MVDGRIFRRARRVPNPPCTGPGRICGFRLDVPDRVRAARHVAARDRRADRGRGRHRRYPPARRTDHRRGCPEPRHLARHRRRARAGQAQRRRAPRSRPLRPQPHAEHRLELLLVGRAALVRASGRDRVEADHRKGARDRPGDPARAGRSPARIEVGQAARQGRNQPARGHVQGRGRGAPKARRREERPAWAVSQDALERVLRDRRRDEPQGRRADEGHPRLRTRR